MRNKLSIILLTGTLLTATRLAYAQDAQGTSAALQHILERLDQLEQQNRELVQQVKALRQEISTERAGAEKSAAPIGDTASPSVGERVAVNEARVAEQAQTKVEAAHKNPIQLTGLVLFNAFTNSNANNVAEVKEYSLLPDPYRSGATVEQTLLGFNFQGPHLPAGGRVNGSLVMDFWGGPTAPGLSWIRLRRASVSLDWANRSFVVGQDKPLISPREPDSLAEVGIPPLSGAGNFWYWLPQARYEERVHLGSNSGITGQVALIQTGGNAYQTPAQKYDVPQPTKPALEGRVAFWHQFDDTRRFEVAPGFHVTSVHTGGAAVGSRIGSLDWLITPARFLTITGTVFTGRNVAGIGSLGNSIAFGPNGIPHAVHSSGGWTQFAFPLTTRLTWNVFGGVENDSAADLSASSLVHNWSYASNLMYHLNANLIVGLEGLQMRTRSAAGVTGVQNRYDLAFGYLF